ncbi:MAG: YegS/Rv2252/BmrU family lipid kinase [Caldithrix sp.]|nr:YegS/Rv2252/BmrU family lipid kinase [Caldithrix sp.]
MHYLFVINPIAGGKKDGRAIGNRILNFFSDHSEITAEIKISEEPGQGGWFAREAVKKKYDAVIAVGGDGTVNEIGGSLLNSDTALGIIPDGSGNGFARSMDIPLKFKKALHVLIRPKFKTIDTGQLNKLHFMGIAGVGYDAQLSSRFEKSKTRGPIPYFYYGFLELFRYPFDELQIIIDDQQKLKIDPLLVTIANTQQYGNGAVIAPMADVQDGLFDLCIIDRLSFSAAVKNVRFLFNKHIERSNIYHHHQCDHLTIHRKKPGWVHVDGDPVWEDNELNVQINKQSLNVIVPAP